jgi:hypothetical protein
MCVALRMYVCAVWFVLCQNFFTDVDVVDAVCDQLITNNFYFFFLMYHEIEYIVPILSSSCHDIPRRLNIVIVCY